MSSFDDLAFSGEIDRSASRSLHCDACDQAVDHLLPDNHECPVCGGALREVAPAAARRRAGAGARDPGARLAAALGGGARSGGGVRAAVAGAAGAAGDGARRSRGLDARVPTVTRCGPERPTAPHDHRVSVL